jgi:3-hydroxyethyl bacteriochlorophyllide a dehydrogenase
MREARLRISAEFREPDLDAVKALLDGGRLSLDGLITHRRDASAASEAYRTAFNDADCLKMVLDWRETA